MGGFRDDFDGPALDRSVWLPHYLPVWSSSEATRASHRIDDGRLVLDIPVGHPLWCPDDHAPPLRVSGIQSGSWSGPLGSTLGQQRFKDGLTVKEEQERFEGWLPSSGRVEVRCAMDLSPRSMAALWMSGFEDDPDQAGEICPFEIFGNAVRDGSAEVGMGVKKVYDPHLVHDFDAPRLELDVAQMHTYAVDWDAETAVFSVDGADVRRCAGPPTYPLQVMVAVFDFPEWSTGDDDHLVPRLVVDHVAGW